MTGRLVCVLVGLPARGKTYIGQKICKYVNWLGVRSQVFNVGTYRRKVAGARLHHGFFDSENVEAVQLRQQAALDALNDLLSWIMEEDYGVAIYDATNTTRERREWIKSHIKDKCQILYVESVCTDQNIILSNIFEVKISGPDYLGTDTSPEEAANDFQQRMKHYEKVYQPLNRAEDGHVSFVKLINVQQNIIVNKVTGWIPSRIAYYLMNLHITPRKIFLSRHGESEYNVLGKIGGDSLLSERGTKYSELLPGILYKYLEGGSVKVWTSTLKRTIATASHLTYDKKQLKALDEIDAGICDGLTYEEINIKHPEEFEYRSLDKFRYRYQGGESYLDLVHRLEPVIMDLERQENILIVGHQATLRTIYAYFHNYKQKDIPYIDIPLHTLIVLTPKAYGCAEERISADIKAVNTYRARQASLDGEGVERRLSRTGRVAINELTEHSRIQSREGSIGGHK